ncbi:MAG TPA: hypothetical protein VMI53_02825 [Opitutaceae bacterium]|nr:hypothetical protein [Opitutaceae bacterium]
MDPFDMPASTEVSACLKYWSKPEFEDSFFIELSENEDDLPLQDMCLSGGYPSNSSAEFYDLKIEKELGEIVYGSFGLSFTEKSSTGCRDMTWEDTIRGRIYFSLRLIDGYVEFEPPRIKREYEKDEF